MMTDKVIMTAEKIRQRVLFSHINRKRRDERGDPFLGSPRTSSPRLFGPWKKNKISGRTTHHATCSQKSKHFDLVVPIAQNL